MELREPAPIPIPFDFSRFLASSITFMAHLSQVTVYFHNKCLVKLTKSAGIPKSLGVPNSLNGTSRMGIMHINNVNVRRMFDL
jgi:hypothetical protein